MNVLLGVVRRVKLDDPVNVGNVQTPGRHVGAQQDPAVGVTELDSNKNVNKHNSKNVNKQNSKISTEQFNSII